MHLLCVCAAHHVLWAAASLLCMHAALLAHLPHASLRGTVVAIFFHVCLLVQCSFSQSCYVARCALWMMRSSCSSESVV